MEIIELNKLVDQLNILSIKGYEKIKWGDALYYSLYYYEKKKKIYELKSILAPILKGRYSLECVGKTGFVFLFSSAYCDRNDHKDKFDKVTSQVPGKSVLVYRKGVCLKNILQIHRIIEVYNQIKGINISRQLRRFISYWIYTLICEQCEVEAVLKKNRINMKVLISYCDVFPVDSMLIQHYNRKKIRTITLQQAQYNIKIEKYRVAYEKSYSDFFLCFGGYIKTTCRYLNIDQEKLIPLGPPEIIGKKLPQHMRKPCKQKFGVVMSFFEAKEENKRLLMCAAEIAQRTGYSVRIRLHPSLEISDFSDYIVTNVMEICDKKESMEDFVESIDFAIVGSSSVFQTFVSMLVPIYRYIVDSNEDPFRGIDWCVFSDSEKGIFKIKEFLDNPENVEAMLIDTRIKLIGDGDVALNYKRFFNNLAIEIEKNEKNT